MAKLTQSRQVEQTLSFIAQRGRQADGEAFLSALVKYLGNMLDVEYVIIDRLCDPPTDAETLAFFGNNRLLPNVRYSLKGTPCENVMVGKLCCYADNVQQSFPEDIMLADMQISSYAGLPLWNTAGEVIGLLAVMDNKAFECVEAITAILQLVAPCAAAELDRQRSEQVLSESRQFLNKIIDSIPDPVFVKDRQHRWILLNQAFCQFIGQPPEVLPGKSDFDFFPLHLAGEFLDQDEAVFVTGKENISETELIGPDGLSRTVILKKTCYTDDSGQAFLVGIILDITNRKQAELALRENEEKLRGLYELSSLGIALTDLNGRFLEFNEAFRAICGYPAEELMTLDYWTLTPKEYAAKEAEQLERLTRTGRYGPYEKEYNQKDGKRVPIHLNGVLITGKDGCKYIWSFVENISARKQMEKKLQRREEEFRLLVEHTPDPIFRYDKEYRRIYVNPAVEQITGKSAASLLNKIPSDGSIVSASEGQKLVNDLQTVLKTGQTVESDVEYLAPSGEIQYYHNNYVPEFGQDGEVIGVISIGRNITKRKQAETRLRKREEDMRTLLDRSPDIIVSYDSHFRRVFVNRAHEKMANKSRAELLGKTPLEDWVAPTQPGEAEVFMRHLSSVLAAGEEEDWDMNWTDRDGLPVCYAFRGVPVLDDAGNVVGVLTFARDISARVRAEQAVQARKTEFRMLVENLPTMVVRYDRNCLPVYVNPIYLQMVNRLEAEILDKPIAASWLAINISSQSYIEILTEAMASGKKTEVLLEWLDGNGSLIAHAMKIVPEFNADGQSTGVLALGFDISDHYQRRIIEASRLSIFEKMAQGSDIKTILGQVARYVESSKPGQRCGIFLLDDQQKLLEAVAAPSFPEAVQTKIDQLISSEVDKPCCPGWAASASRCETIIPEEIVHLDCLRSFGFSINEIGAKAYWSEPIYSSTKQLLGVISLYLNHYGAPDETDLAMLRQVCHLSSIAIERKRIEQKIYHQASYDPLTGLLNRHLFIDRLHEEASKCRRNGSKLALLFIDLDHFKEVNDTLGHQFGDQLLVQSAERIRKSVRESDIVARLAGDEFVVIIAYSDSSADIGLIGEHIVEALSKPFPLADGVAHISASIGIACYPDDTGDINQLLGCADQSMYAVKKTGRNGVNFFTQSMQSEAQERLQLSNDLRMALQGGQLQVHFQPIINIQTGQVEKAEALLRWLHPQRGMVRPDVFIPLAEETGAIHQIGDWVFYQSAAVAKQWQNLCAGKRQISVNVSPRQFVRGSPDIAWLEHLRSIDLNPESVVIEITEGLLLDDQTNVIHLLRRFQQAGIQIALDDFGTGYSAMAYLKKFNIDYLKIDRSFVRDLETDSGDRAIAEAIVVMAHRLGLKVIAEGVETKGQQEILTTVGCDYVQGYLYAKPMPVEAFLDFAMLGADVNLPVPAE